MAEVFIGNAYYVLWFEHMPYVKKGFWTLSLVGDGANAYSISKDNSFPCWSSLNRFIAAVRRKAGRLRKECIERV